MFRLHSFRFVFILSLLLGSSMFAMDQADPIERHWLNEEGTAKIQIYKARDGKFYGKIVWLKVPDRNGGPKVDEKNPDPKKRNQPILGLLILKAFVKDGDKGYSDGTIYDPKNGKTYSCKMTREGNVLEVRGYVGISLLGRTTTWTASE